MRSITGPVTLGSITAALAVAVLIGWILVIYQNLRLSQEVTKYLWLLVAGIVSLAFILAVLIMFTVFLASEIILVRRQTSFIDSVTHELKSPLASLRLCLDTLARAEISSEQREQLRVMMVDAVDRLSDFIDDVLTASQLAHGQRGVTLTQVELRTLARHCAELVGARYHLEPDELTIVVPDGIEVSTDATALETVLKNLIDNAIKYSDPPRHVEILGRGERGRVVIEVRDRGIGIPRDVLRRVFDRFYRVDSEAVRRRHGTGLGLFVVKSLVAGIGGKLEAESDGPGAGTTMRLSLPRPEIDPRPTPAEART